MKNEKTKTVKQSVKKQEQTISLPTEKNHNSLIWILGIISAIVYFNTLKHGFVLDDVAVIEQNKFVTQGISGIPKILSTFYWEGYWDSNAGLYRPLSLIMFSIEWSLSPNNPFIHHFMNVILYVLCVVLLYKLLKKLLPDFEVWIPFVVTLLFAVHPIHTEVVANIKSRDEILCFLFFILTFLQLLKAKKTFVSQGLAAFLFFLCLLSKEAGILFLPIIGLYFLIIKKEQVKTIALKLAPVAVVGIVWFAIHQSVIHSSAGEPITYTYNDNSLVGCGNKASQVASGISILGKYLQKSVFPANLTYDYSFNEIPCSTFASPSVWLTLIVVIALLAIGFVFRKKQPWLLFGALFFLIAISLVTNIFTLIGTTFGERLLFTPVLGIILFVVIGIQTLLKSRSTAFFNAGSGILLVAAVVFAGQTCIRNQDWFSNETLFEAAVKTGSNSSRVHANHGTMLMNNLLTDSIQKAELYKTAIIHFNKALGIDPLNKDAMINSAVCYYRIRDYKNSIRMSKQALQLVPADTSIFLNLADAFYENKQLDSSIIWYWKALPSEVTNVGSFERLGMIYFNRQQLDEAIEVYKLGLKRYPDHENMKMNLANCYGQKEQYAPAIQLFKQVYERNPQNKAALQLLVMSLARNGETAEADRYNAILVGTPPPPANQ